MFDIASSELLVVAIVALLVVGPKDLPKLMRTVGQWVRRARMMTGQIRAGFDQMMQEAEFQEERERIMKMHPDPAPEPAATTPAPAAPAPQYDEAVQTFSASGSGVGPTQPVAPQGEAGEASADVGADAGVDVGADVAGAAAQGQASADRIVASEPRP